MHRRPTHPGFTLIELLLVLVVISAALGIAAPSLSHWGRGQRLRDAGDELLATVRWARAQAIANSRTYRLNVDPSSGRYWLTAMDGLEFVPLDTEFARESAIPDNATLAMNDLQSRPIEFLTFDPSGRTSTGIVQLSDERGTITIVCETPAEGFRLLKAGEAIQP